MERVASLIVEWMRREVADAGAEGVVLGVSGGLDSAVVAALCQRAFPHTCLGLCLPCYSAPDDLGHARAVAERFGVPVRTIDLGPALDAIVESLHGLGLASSPEAEHLARANLKPRLRMLTLYYVAGRLGYLVVGTSNASELAVGYFTKYGDGGVDILPLGNTLKTDVRRLARHLGVPEEVVSKAPSGGLWQGQTDEAELGVTYAELDRYLATGEARPEVKQRIDGLVSRSAHKRKQPPMPPPLGEYDRA